MQPIPPPLSQSLPAFSLPFRFHPFPRVARCTMRPMHSLESYQLIGTFHFRSRHVKSEFQESVGSIRVECYIHDERTEGLTERAAAAFMAHKGIVVRHMAKRMKIIQLSVRINLYIAIQHDGDTNFAIERYSLVS